MARREIPLPVSMNVDSPPHQLAADEGPVVTNIQRVGQGGVAHRRGFKRVASVGDWRTADFNGNDGFVTTGAIPVTGGVYITGLIARDTVSSTEYQYFPRCFLHDKAETRIAGVVTEPTYPVEPPSWIDSFTQYAGDYTSTRLPAYNHFIADDGTVYDTSRSVTGGGWLDAGGGAFYVQPFWNRTARYDNLTFAVPTGAGGPEATSTTSGSSYVHSTRLNAFVKPPLGLTDSNPFLGTATINNGDITVTVDTANAVSDAVADGLTPPFFVYWGSAAAKPYLLFINEVVDMDASANELTLRRPYGYGESTTNVPNLSGVTMTTFFGQAPVMGAPVDPNCVATHLDRLWLGAGFVMSQVGPYQGYYSTLLSWSKPGNPWFWPNANFIVVDDNYFDPILGLSSLGVGRLIVARKDSMYILDGVHEGEFVVRQWLSNYGLVHPNAICDMDDSTIWASRDGVMQGDGSGSPVNLTRPAPGRGIGVIHDRWVNRWNPDNAQHEYWTNHVSLARLDNDRIGVSYAILTGGIETPDSYQDPESYVFDFVHSAWTKFEPAFEVVWRQGGNAATTVLADTDTYNRSVVALHQCFVDSSETRLNDYINNEDELDFFYTSAGGNAFEPVQWEIQTGDFAVAGGDTFKLNRVWVFHGSAYYDASAASAAIYAAHVSVKNDDNTGSWTSIGDMSYEQAGTSDFPNRRDLQYTWEPNTTYQVRGRTMRLRLVGDETDTEWTAQNVDARWMTLYNVYVDFDEGVRGGRAVR